jgi:hypothetical protein
MPTNRARNATLLKSENSVIGYHTFFLQKANHCELKLNEDASATFRVDGVLLVQIDRIDVTTMLDQQNSRATSYVSKSTSE